MSKFNLRGKLTLTVHSARALSNKELLGKMDPFAVVTISGSKDEKFKTKIAKDQHQTPSWEQSYIFNLEGREEILHANVWNQATLGDDHIGRCDLSLDALDMSGRPAWYQLKDKNNFTKQTGELRMTCVFEGTGLPPGSLAYTTNEARKNPAPAAAGAASPATPQIPAQPIATVSPPVAQSAPAPVVYGSQQPAQTPSPVVYGSQQQQPAQQASAPYASQQPNYQQPPPQQYQSQAPPQQQYQQPPPQYQQQPQQPVYSPPQQPMYQQSPAPVYSQPPMQPVYQSQPQAVVYQSQPTVVTPVYQSQAPVVFQQPGITFQPAPQVYVSSPQPQVVYQQQSQGYPGAQRQGQLIGYWPNGQPRYA